MSVLFTMLISDFSQNLSSKIKIPVKKYCLENGMRILLNRNEKSHTISYILGVSVGSRHEKRGITGISHMFEHLMFKGTKKYPQFDQIYTDNGIIHTNAFTSKDYTAYHATLPKDKLELILNMESDRISNLTFTQEELDKERSAVQEERLLRVDNHPMGLLIENTFDLLFTKHPYRHPIIGYAKDISSYNLDNLNQWYKTYYSPNNAVLALSGNFSISEAKNHIKKYFGVLTQKKIPKETKIIEPEPSSPRFRFISKEVKSPKVILSYLGPPLGTKEAYAMDIITEIFGGGESSLLYKKMVREQKLLSFIDSFLIDTLNYTVFGISYSLSDLSQERKIKTLILNEIQAWLNQGPDRFSMEKVKIHKYTG